MIYLITEFLKKWIYFNKFFFLYYFHFNIFHQHQNFFIIFFFSFNSKYLLFLLYYLYHYFLNVRIFSDKPSSLELIKFFIKLTSFLSLLLIFKVLNFKYTMKISWCSFDIDWRPFIHFLFYWVIKCKAFIWSNIWFESTFNFK